MFRLLGIDVGSTTVKISVVEPITNKILYTSYERHFSKVKECVISELKKLSTTYGENFKVSITGSAGLGLAQKSGINFAQEVQSAFIAVKTYYPDTDCTVELGGEDAKIIFFTGGTEQRMNGSCAGGTGAFIDQMATLLNLSVTEMDNLALKSTKIYPIASRCGVFAKSDIQPLINQGAEKSDISASIFQAVVDQTVAGLAQGREIKGKVLFLGGPLYFLKSLRKAFTSTLKLDSENAIFPENAPCFMSIGSALHSNGEKEITLNEIISKLESVKANDDIITGEPLFKDKEEYSSFVERHKKSDLQFENISAYEGNAYLGIDSGSTTTKMILISEDNKILYSHYQTNNGQPLDIVINKLKEIYSIANKNLVIKGVATTGYGEDLIKSAIKGDVGIVETVAHFKAALYFNPKADFIIDIGGQDIKCFKVKNHAIDSIMLNEACSSGCGSFIQTFAKAMNMDIEAFSKLGLFAKHPVELGSRCTVFMNSSVKQAQKEGASIEDISAGLSASIVKNAIYKVIRARTPEELGSEIVVQGGTFMNDAVLRSFEIETGKNVMRPAIAGLMGAFGCALYVKEIAKNNVRSTVLTKEQLEKFTYKSIASNCHGCTSKCNINIINFDDGRRYISGNKCERGAGLKPTSNDNNLFAYKYDRLISYVKKIEQIKDKKFIGKVGLPMQLVMFEQLPLWNKFFESLGFEVVLSDKSSRDLYFKGQHTIASDTVCYPAKLMHGHIESLIEKQVDFIFYPCESYNFDEKDGDNHYNCPVVAYYPELLKANNKRLNNNNLISPYIDPNNAKKSAKTLKESLGKLNYKFSLSQILNAYQSGVEELNKYHGEISIKAQELIARAERENKQIIVLAGRPYHADPEINHGIGKLLNSLGFVVITEDSIFEQAPLVNVNVLNQWTYHARLYRAGEFVAKRKNMNLVQLVSFGCGIDAITTDELRNLLERNGKLYTQIKIDEINNLGVVKIRLRSLMASIEEQSNNNYQQEVAISKDEKGSK